MTFHSYLETLCGILEKMAREQPEGIRAAARLAADAVAGGGVVHVFGAGHSHMIAEEAFYRAGGIVPVNPILDRRLIFLDGVLESTRAEREPGYAARILAGVDIRPGDAAILVSNSGRNVVPVEMALGFRERGIPVIAITSVVQSRRSASRHASGKRLFELADVVVDTGVPEGDAAVALPGLAARVGACSTVAGAAAIQSILVEAVAELLARGKPVPVLASANVGDAGEEVYRRQIEPYAARIPYYDAAARSEP